MKRFSLKKNRYSRISTNILGLSACLFSLVITGCKKLVDVPPPVSQLASSQVFNNASTATAAQTAIYEQMVSAGQSYYISFENGLLSDEFKNYSTGASQIAYYQNAMANTATFSNYGCWNAAFNYIYEANAIIAGLQNNKAIPSKVSDQLTGESEFIRAFWYFYLVNEYGDVPLALTTDYNTNKNLSRIPKAQVYQQMISDLKNAETKLNSQYVDATDTTITTVRVRPNQSVAAALLARVYLYNGDYIDAISESSKVINNPAYHLISPLTPANYVFNISNNSEAIWQLYTPLPASLNGATQDGYLYILSGKPSSISLSTQLISAFEPGDQRFNIWVGSITSGGVTYYYPWKYKIYSKNGSATNITEYIMVLRLAEQYLIRAEAEANMGDVTNLANAVNDLNVIRNRAGLPNYAGMTDKPSLLTAILHERQVELFSEWGNRWFDLNRTGIAGSVMGAPGNVTQSKGGTWVSTDALYPIPLSEITNDHNLSQNPGY